MTNPSAPGSVGLVTPELLSFDTPLTLASGGIYVRDALRMIVSGQLTSGKP